MSANEFKDQDIVKPHWFSLVESDTKIQKQSRDRGIRVAALAGPLLLISAGLLFAQTNEGQNASATEETSIASSVTAGTSELASSTPNDVGVATDPVATNTSGASVGVTSQSTPAHSPDSTPSSSRTASGTSSGTSVSPTTTTNSFTPSAPTQGFVPPATGISQGSSDDDDDAYEGDRGHGDDDDAYEHEDSDEGDDD